MTALSSLGPYPMLLAIALGIWPSHGVPLKGSEIPHGSPPLLKDSALSEGFNVLEHLTGISPYFDSPGVSLPQSPPPSCQVKRAAYIIRHSNIYANDFDYTQYIQPFTEKVFNFGAQRPNFSVIPELAFLTNWSTPITNSSLQLEKVTSSGAVAARVLGKAIAGQYSDLLQTTSNLSVFNIWSSSASRDTNTAITFTEGLLGRVPATNISANTGLNLITVSEDKNLSANTLVPHATCNNFDPGAGADQSMAWVATYTAPIIQRFNTALPQFNFSALDIYAMQQLCGYETVIKNSSDFCAAFEPAEWLGFEYANDLMYWYSLGFGQPLAPTLGMPWLNATTELLASTNSTQPLWFSFTHREEPPFVLTALNLFNNSAYSPSSNVNETMPTSEINFSRAWKTSNILPFLGHVALERLECEPSIPSFTTDAYVRVLVNSAPIPIPGCQTGPAASCPLSDFVSYVQERNVIYGDFTGRCGIDASGGNTTNTLQIYDGNVPQVSL